METFDICIKELTLNEQKEITGGWFPAFVAGAIVGGMIYDVYKAACLAAFNAQVNHPDYYSGAVHSQR